MTFDTDEPDEGEVISGEEVDNAEAESGRAADLSTVTEVSDEDERLGDLKEKVANRTASESEFCEYQLLLAGYDTDEIPDNPTVVDTADRLDVEEERLADEYADASRSHDDG